MHLYAAKRKSATQMAVQSFPAKALCYALCKISCGFMPNSWNSIHCIPHLVILEVEEHDNIVAIQNLH